MVSLWGSKNPDNTQNGDSADRSSAYQEHQARDADERTRLLPPGNDGFLDPDDPAVSPYNLWSVRALRFVSVLFLIVTFLWWVLLLVSIFISPPTMHSRGSGFFDFSFTTLTLGNLLLAIIFFATPSKAMQVGGALVAVVLFVDMILILASPHLRYEEGWVGIVSVVWALVMALFNIITDRVVAWGKREEEERLTGRQENRRTLSEWLAVFIDVIVVIVLLAITICLTGTLSLRIRDATLQVPGERIFVDGNKYQVHVNCIGNATYDSAGKKNPTFLIEAGEYPFESTLDDFISSAYRNGTIDRYCYWDRPGFSFSDNAPSPLSAGMAASALSEALSQSDELGPWILVSAGVGGIYSRIFSSRAGNIRGMILIDTLHEDLLYTIGRPGQGFLLWAWGIISPLGLDRTPAAVFKGRTREDRVYGRAAYQGGKFIKAKLQENLVADSLTKNEIIQARNIQNKKTPLVVISSGIEVRKDNTWNKMQTDLTKLTDNLKSHDIVSGAPHEVWHTLEGRRVIEKRLGQLART